MNAAIRFFLVWVLISGGLLGCTSESATDLQTWLTQQKSAPPPPLKATPAPAPFTPQVYHPEVAPDPFGVQKLLQVLRREAQKAGAGSELIARELKRRKEPLEQYPLDAMSFVGTLAQRGQLIALIKVDKQLFQVAQGAYIGSNFGKMVKVSESEVVLREVVQDAAGDWVERKANLQLQENR